MDLLRLKLSLINIAATFIFCKITNSAIEINTDVLFKLGSTDYLQSCETMYSDTHKTAQANVLFMITAIS